MLTSVISSHLIQLLSLISSYHAARILALVIMVSLQILTCNIQNMFSWVISGHLTLKTTSVSIGCLIQELNLLTSDHRLQILSPLKDICWLPSTENVLVNIVDFGFLWSPYRDIYFGYILSPTTDI